MNRGMAQVVTAEFLGTFLLVFAGAGAVVIDAVSNGGVTAVGIGLSFGLAVMAAIVIFGSVSGAHINPAVTVSFCARGYLSIPKGLAYIGAQLAGAAAAAGVLRAVFDRQANLGATIPSDTALQALVLEIVLTFFLLMVIFRVAKGDHIELTLAAIAVGAYVGLAATFAGPIAGASMNPARSFGPALLSGAWTDHWVYWAGPLLGALLAAPIFEFLKAPAPGTKNDGEEES